MELEELYKKLLSEGCNSFYIEGVGPSFTDGIECLGQNSGLWEIYYMERGQKDGPSFSTTDKDLAIKTYYERITRYEHWHIIAFTRSEEVLKRYAEKLAAHHIRTVQNDIPNYAAKDDRVYRLFVVNKDIFKARELFDDIPYYDEKLKRY